MHHRSLCLLKCIFFVKFPTNFCNEMDRTPLNNLWCAFCLVLDKNRMFITFARFMKDVH